MIVNGFEDYIDGYKKYPPKDLPSREPNLEFLQWHRFDRMIPS